MESSSSGLESSAAKQPRRRDSANSVASTISQLGKKRKEKTSGDEMGEGNYSCLLLPGQEARSHRSSLTAAFSSMFRSKRSSASSTTSTPNTSITSSPSLQAMPVSSPSSLLDQSLDSTTSSVISSSMSTSLSSSPYKQLSREVRQHALAAVLLEEWLQELAAIAQEHCVLQKEHAFEIGMGLNFNPGSQQQFSSAKFGGVAVAAAAATAVAGQNNNTSSQCANNSNGSSSATSAAAAAATASAHNSSGLKT